MCVFYWAVEKGARHSSVELWRQSSPVRSPLRPLHPPSSITPSGVRSIMKWTDNFFVAPARAATRDWRVRPI